MLKKIPGVSLIAGLGFGLNKLLSGDGVGAMMEVASGLAGTIPGLGTIASTAIDAASAARDISKEASIGGVGGDDFRFDDLAPAPKVEMKPFKESILPDVDNITDVGFDYSTFDMNDYPVFNQVANEDTSTTNIIPQSGGLMDGSTKTPSATSQTGGENFTPVNAPKDVTPQYNSNSKLNEIYSSHITTKDDGKVIERHVDSVKDIRNEVKEHYKSRGMSDSSISSLMSHTSTADVYNQALLEEVYGKNYSVNIQPQGIYDRNNDMAFTPIVKDDNGIITKILKNPSDHIKKDEEGYVPPNSFMSMSDELSTQYQSDYNTELSTRSMEEQTDRKRLSELQETSFWSGDVANPELDSERTMLEEKIAKNYAPLQTEVNSNQYTVGAKMSELIDNRVNQTSNIQSVNKPSTSTSSSTVLQEHPTTSKQGRDAAYTTSSTRSGAPTKTKESQQPPVIVNNNYNTTNNNVPSSSSSNKQTPPPQMIVNPMPASVWSGGGWGGMR